MLWSKPYFGYFTLYNIVQTLKILFYILFNGQRDYIDTIMASFVNRTLNRLAQTSSVLQQHQSL
jgi:hypothetical protein